MRIQKSEELSKLANAANITEDQLSEALINELRNREMVCDDEANYGSKLLYCFNPDTSVSDVVGLLNSLGIEDVRSKHINWLLFLKIIGDGD